MHRCLLGNLRATPPRQVDWLFPEPILEEEPTFRGRIRLRRGFSAETEVSAHAWLLPETRVSPGKAQARLVFVSRTETVKRP
jgi:hypothetical protein